MAPMAIETTPTPVNIPSKKSSHTIHFISEKHLAYFPPSGVLSMQDIGLAPTKISNVAHTQPFPLMSYEAVVQHRRELFNPETLDKCMHHTRPGSVQVRGAAPRYAPFIHEFWHSKEVLDIISKHAGVDLVPVMDYEIAHCNAQLGPAGLEGIRATPVEPPAATEEAIAAFENTLTKPNESKMEANPIIEWHKDSHPFVCVVMLSDARHMTGGETELQGGNGRNYKVKAPQMGHATILQGRYITHLGVPASNMPERVTVVTSFRPRNPLLVDDTTNMNIRNKSHLTELYYQWTLYRLDVLAQRAQIARKELKAKYEKNVKATDRDGKPGMCMVDSVNLAEFKNWAKEQTDYIEHTIYEMRPLETKSS